MMPTRLLREGILDSEAVNALSPQAEVFYRRLMSVVDDFGRYDGRPAMLKSRLYPLKASVRETDIPRWIAECETAGLIALYVVAGKQYILFRKLGSARAKSSKYPAPPPGLDDQSADANVCAQTQASATGSYSGSSSYSGAGKDSAASGTDPPPKPLKTFVKPTPEEVRAYCAERGKGVDPEAWYDHYAANGWRVGKNPMKDWKAAVRTWEKNHFSKASAPSVNGKPHKSFADIAADAERAAKGGAS